MLQSVILWMQIDEGMNNQPLHLGRLCAHRSINQYDATELVLQEHWNSAWRNWNEHLNQQQVLRPLLLRMMVLQQQQQRRRPATILM
jgi:hypothetical protein